MSDQVTFDPDWASSPGETIADILADRDISVEDFAARLGEGRTFADELLSGESLLTLETAEKLASVLGASVQFWMRREAEFREGASGDRAKSRIEWLSEIPAAEMKRFGWLRPGPSSRDEQAVEALEFFGVKNVAAWRESYGQVLEAATFRTSRSFESRPGAVAAWLRRGEILAETIRCDAWNSDAFSAVLSRVRVLTRTKDPKSFLPKLVGYCATAGVAVTIVPAPTPCRASGATRFLSSQKALLMLSVRYLSDDHFWFTFFHEAGHLLLHGKRSLFLEGVDSSETSKEEEANQFATRTLVPDEYRAEMFRLPVQARAVIEFARRLRIAPGIIVGQLQHYNLAPKSHLNGLKRRYAWE